METISYRNESEHLQGELTATYDSAAGFVRTTGKGFFSVKQTRAFFIDWRREVHRMHAAGRPVYVLVDLAGGGVQDQAVLAIIRTSTADLYRPGDAVAMLVPNSLTKLQNRRIITTGFHEFFISRSAAETWLMAKVSGGSNEIGHAA